MNKTVSIALSVALVLSIGTVLLIQPGDTPAPGGGEPTQNVEVREGVQYVTVQAWGGYSPRVTRAQANIPTKLIVKTNGTYDCSAALVIRSIGYQKILSPTGEEVIDLGTRKPGTLQGLCSMGMYNFKIDFN